MAGKDISINQMTGSDAPASGDQRTLAAGQSKFTYNYLTFPKDLGKGKRHPYYMTFFINQQDLSKFLKKGDVAKVNGKKILSEIQKHQTSASTRTLARNLGGTDLGFGRKTSRTKMAIRLFMPDSLSWEYRNGFRDASISGLPLTKIISGVTSAASIGSSMVEGYNKGGGVPGAIASLKKSAKGPQGRGAIGGVVENIGGALLGGDSGLALSVIGIAVNPQLDVLYESPTLREFNFDFLFAPRSEAEAQEVAKIVKAFKFHAAPEILADGSIAGRYFVPPSEFDIEFSVPTMGKISTCVLTSITLDYGSSGAAFFNNDAPTYTRMTLAFKELEFITKELIEDNNY